jgi:hypothetical protein
MNIHAPREGTESEAACVCPSLVHMTMHIRGAEAVSDESERSLTLGMDWYGDGKSPDIGMSG